MLFAAIESDAIDPFLMCTCMYYEYVPGTRYVCIYTSMRTRYARPGMLVPPGKRDARFKSKGHA